MKKIVSILLTIMLLASCCSCGISSSWRIEQTVDEFGDITKNSKSIISGVFPGTFSNTAVTDGELQVFVNFEKNGIFNHYNASFDLKEYGNVSAVYSSADSLTFKMKINDEITVFDLKGSAPNGKLYLGTADYNIAGDCLFNELYAGNDVRCIINIGSSEYNFTIKSSTLSDLCKNNGFAPGAATLTTKEAVKILLDDHGLYSYGAIDWFKENMEQFELMNSEEIKSLLDGYFLNISFVCTCVGNYTFPYWYVFKYSQANNLGKVVAEHEYNDYYDSTVINNIKKGIYTEAYKKYRIFLPATSAPDLILSYNNDTLIRTIPSKNRETPYQYRKVTDDILIECLKNSNGEFSPSGLYIRMSGSDLYDIASAVSKAYTNYLPNIPD